MARLEPIDSVAATKVGPAPPAIAAANIAGTKSRRPASFPNSGSTRSLSRAQSSAAVIATA